MARQGQYAYTGRDTVVTALAQAGLAETAWPQQVRVSRPAKEGSQDRATAVVDFKHVYQTGDLAQNYLLEEGDIIEIPYSPLSAWDAKTRRLLGPLTGTAGAAAAIVLRPSVASAQQVPFSSGSERPKLVAPPNATDCHHHIYDHKYPVDPRSTLRPPDATVDDYRKLQQRLGITRHVIIQPSTYGTDNRDVIESVAAFGPAARGIAVVEDSISDRELKDMDAKGVRGLRFNLGQPGAPSISMLESLSGRINDLGWHVQVNVLGRDLPGIMDILRRLPDGTDAETEIAKARKARVLGVCRGA